MDNKHSVISNVEGNEYIWILYEKSVELKEIVYLIDTNTIWLEIFRVYLNNIYTSFYTQIHMRNLSSSLHHYLCVHHTHPYKLLILLLIRIIRVLRLFQLLLLVLLTKPVKWSTNSTKYPLCWCFESCKTAKTQRMDFGFKP